MGEATGRHIFPSVAYDVASRVDLPHTFICWISYICSTGLPSLLPFHTANQCSFYCPQRDFSRTILQSVFPLGTVLLCSTFHIPLLNLIKLFLSQSSSPLQCLHAVDCLCSVSAFPRNLMMAAVFFRRHGVL